MATDPLEYTYTELEGQLNLLENHLKESRSDPGFCIDCVNKHASTIFALSIEGTGFAQSDNERKKFEDVADYFRNFKKKSDVIENGPEYANEVRKYRKMLIYGPKPCSSCERKTKNLNITSDYDDSNSYSNIDYEVREMAGKNDLMEVGVINGSQLIGYGGLYAGSYLDKKRVEKDPVADMTWTKRPSTWVGIGGGVGLQLLGVFLVKKDIPRTALIVAGSYMLVTTLATVIKEATMQSGTAMRARRMMSPIRMSVGGALPQQGLVRVD